MSAQDAELILAFLGIGIGIGAAYGFVSTVISEIATRRKEDSR